MLPVEKSLPAAPLPKQRQDDDSDDEFDFVQEFSRSNVKEIIHLITTELKEHGVQTEYLMLPFRPEQRNDKMLKFLNSIFPLGNGIMIPLPKAAVIVGKTEPLVLFQCLKYLWCRLPEGTIIGWEAYHEFESLEKKQNYPQKAFLEIMPRCLASSDHASIVYDFLDLIVSVASNARKNKMSARKIARMCGLWAFGKRQRSSLDFDLKREDSFMTGLDDWIPASDAMFHLLLAFMRSFISDTDSLPSGLQNLLVDAKYPPVASEAGTMITVPLVTLKTNEFSRKPLDLIEKINSGISFDNPDSFPSKEEYSILKNLFKKKNSVEGVAKRMSRESRRLVKQLSTKHSTFQAGWVRQKNLKNNLPLAIDVSLVTIDDYYIWAWLSSLSFEETAQKKKTFGRTLIAEFEFDGFKKWVVFQEVGNDSHRVVTAPYDKFQREHERDREEREQMERELAEPKHREEEERKLREDDERKLRELEERKEQERKEAERREVERREAERREAERREAERREAERREAERREAERREAERREAEKRDIERREKLRRDAEIKAKQLEELEAQQREIERQKAAIKSSTSVDSAFFDSHGGDETFETLTMYAKYADAHEKSVYSMVSDVSETKPLDLTPKKLEEPSKLNDISRRPTPPVSVTSSVGNTSLVGAINYDNDLPALPVAADRKSPETKNPVPVRIPPNGNAITLSPKFTNLGAFSSSPSSDNRSSPLGVKFPSRLSPEGNIPSRLSPESNIPSRLSPEGNTPSRLSPENMASYRPPPQTVTPRLSPDSMTLTPSPESKSLRPSPESKSLRLSPESKIPILPDPQNKPFRPSPDSSSRVSPQREGVSALLNVDYHSRAGLQTDSMSKLDVKPAWESTKHSEQDGMYARGATEHRLSHTPSSSVYTDLPTDRYGSDQSAQDNRDRAIESLGIRRNSSDGRHHQRRLSVDSYGQGNRNMGNVRNHERRSSGDLRKMDRRRSADMLAPMERKSSGEQIYLQDQRYAAYNNPSQERSDRRHSHDPRGPPRVSPDAPFQRTPGKSPVSQQYMSPAPQPYMSPAPQNYGPPRGQFQGPPSAGPMYPPPQQMRQQPMRGGMQPRPMRQGPPGQGPPGQHGQQNIYSPPSGRNNGHTYSDPGYGHPQGHPQGRPMHRPQNGYENIPYGAFPSAPQVNKLHGGAANKAQDRKKLFNNIRDGNFGI